MNRYVVIMAILSILVVGGGMINLVAPLFWFLIRTAFICVAAGFVIDVALRAHNNRKEIRTAYKQSRLKL